MADELTIDQIDDLEDDEVIESGNEDLIESPNEGVENTEESSNAYDEYYTQPQNIQTDENEQDVLDMFLKTKGIQDSTKIKFQDDQGNLYSKDWDDLSAEEQYNILNGTTEEDEMTALDEYEIGLINELRRSGVTPNEFINTLRQSSINDYIAAQQQNNNYQEYDLDELTDDEIYALDLQSRIENITDDELRDVIENAKSNPDFYAKQVAGIRREYQNLVEENRNRTIAQQQAIAQQQEREIRDSIVESVGNLNNLGLPIELDYNDLEQIADHILEKDVTGTTAFSRAFNDPNAVAKMAFYNMYGDTIINDIVTYFQDEISRVSQTQYDRGFNAGQKNQQKAPARFAYKPTSQNITSVNQINEYTIDDLDN